MTATASRVVTLPLADNESFMTGGYATPTPTRVFARPGGSRQADPDLLLNARFEVVLVNVRHAKNLPGPGSASRRQTPELSDRNGGGLPVFANPEVALDTSGQRSDESRG
jgi:hypothetical protein